MTIDELVHNQNLGPFDYEDQQIVGRELVISNLEDAVQLFLQFFNEEELEVIVATQTGSL